MILKPFIIQQLSDKQVNILSYILNTCTPNMYWNYTISKRNFIQTTFELSKSTIERCIKTLCNRNILCKVGKGEYSINKEIITIEK